MNKTNIEWCDYTWNPVTGCKRECEYCYARKIYNRFNKTPFSNIIFHEERIRQPCGLKKKPASKIFVGSMSDIQFWPIQYTEKILHTVNLCPKHTFMFLSKSSMSYRIPSMDFGWPGNTMQGLTVEMPGKKVSWDIITNMIVYPRPYLSIEPINGGLWKEIPSKYEIVIVGAETGNRKNKTIPQKEWIQSIKDHVPKEKIFWKTNIQEYL